MMHPIHKLLVDLGFTCAAGSPLEDTRCLLVEIPPRTGTTIQDFLTDVIGRLAPLVRVSAPDLVDQMKALSLALSGAYVAHRWSPTSLRADPWVSFPTVPYTEVIEPE